MKVRKEVASTGAVFAEIYEVEVVATHIPQKLQSEKKWRAIIVQHKMKYWGLGHLAELKPEMLGAGGTFVGVNGAISGRYRVFFSSFFL